MKLFQGDDISNWLTLIVEIGIGISIAMIILIYSRYYDQKTINTNNIERSNRENNAREEIYKILRSIPEVREWRERIRTKPDAEFKARGVTRENEVLFSNKRVIRIINSLSFTLTIYSEYFPEQFIKRVNDAINGYDFILNRLELMPMENDDPANVLSKKDGNKGFIEELQKIQRKRDD
jgi:hypothetical protein